MDEGGRGTVAPFVKEMGVNYQVVLGTSEVGDLYGGVRGLPTTFYIGRNGKVLEYVPGLINLYDVEQNIKAALATSLAPAQTVNRHD